MRGLKRSKQAKGVANKNNYVLRLAKEFNVSTCPQCVTIDSRIGQSISSYVKAFNLKVIGEVITVSKEIYRNIRRWRSNFSLRIFYFTITLALCSCIR